jgi:hypothetical protein
MFIVSISPVSSKDPHDYALVTSTEWKKYLDGSQNSPSQGMYLLKSDIYALAVKGVVLTSRDVFSSNQATEFAQFCKDTSLDLIWDTLDLTKSIENKGSNPISLVLTEQNGTAKITLDSCIIVSDSHAGAAAKQVNDALMTKVAFLVMSNKCSLNQNPNIKGSITALTEMGRLQVFPIISDAFYAMLDKNKLLEPVVIE